jgi:hypothetical protein
MPACPDDQLVIYYGNVGPVWFRCVCGDEVLLLVEPALA